MGNTSCGLYLPLYFSSIVRDGVFVNIHSGASARHPRLAYTLVFLAGGVLLCFYWWIIGVALKSPTQSQNPPIPDNGGVTVQTAQPSPKTLSRDMEKTYTLSPQTLEAIRRIVEDSNKASSSEDLRQQVFLLVTALRLFQRDMDRERKYIDAMSDSRRREIEQDPNGETLRRLHTTTGQRITVAGAAAPKGSVREHSSVAS